MEAQAKVRVTPFAVASASACAAAIVACLLLRGESRGPAIYGAVAASFGALCAMSALALSARTTNGVLAGFTIGFLSRAVLLAAGLLASGARGNLALVYVAAFFILYAVTQVIEVLFVSRSARPQGATP